MNMIISRFHALLVLLAATTALLLAPIRLVNAENDSRTSAPKMAGSLPALSGTAWQIDFGKGVTGTKFQFYKAGWWEIVPERRGTIGTVGKSYKVSGNTLETVNRDDGMVQQWKMTWKGDVLELFDGKETLRLHYSGETQL
jgi:hypothetical protein